MILKFLADAKELSGGRVTELPTEGNVTAINIPDASEAAARLAALHPADRRTAFTATTRADDPQ